MPTIHVSAFQPFESRIGIDTVLSLSFAYNPAVVQDVKAAIRNAAARLGERNLGGWLPEQRCWFVERRAWPIVRKRLSDAGHELYVDDSVHDGRAGSNAPGPSPEPEHQLAAAQVRTTIRSWHRRLVREYHPDRRPGQSDEGIRAVNRAHELLLEMLEVSR